MKVAYFCYLTQLDTDLSFIQEAQSKCDITTYIYVNPKHLKKSIIKFSKIYNKTGIFKADIYPELGFLNGVIDLTKIKIININDSPIWQLKALSIFSKLSAKLMKKYDIIHITSFLQPPEFPLYFLGKKLVLSVHDPLPHSSAEGFKNNLARKLAFKVINNFIIFNKTQESEFIKYYHLQNKNILVAHFGIFHWLRLFDCQKENSSQKEPYILFAGRISPYKGVDYLLPAMDTIHKLYPQIKLIIAGGGEFHFDISNWKNKPYIEFRNRFIPDIELIDLIKNSIFMVCPYTDATQSGVVMSAFTFNKPVLATNVGGLPEMVISGKYGLIVKEKDSESLQMGMTKLISNPNLLKEFSSNIEHDYSQGIRSWKEISSKIIDFYQKAMNKE